MLFLVNNNAKSREGNTWWVDGAGLRYIYKVDCGETVVAVRHRPCDRFVSAMSEVVPSASTERCSAPTARPSWLTATRGRCRCGEKKRSLPFSLDYKI